MNTPNSRVALRQQAHQSKEKMDKTGKPKKKRNIFLKILIGIIAIGVICVMAGAALFVYYASSAPKLEESALGATASSKLYAMNKEIIADLGAEKRELVEPNQIPNELKDAVVSVEDRRFYKHIGVDPVRIAGSALHNLTSNSTQGGSTLTQQLIKLSYFSTKASDQTIKRKAQEAWLSIQLERRNSKEEILCYYINKVYMSNGYYGMRTASLAYYGKELNKLNLAQTALLAGMPQAPNAYNPYTEPENAKERRNTVLYTMLTNKKISQEEYDKAVATPINDGLQPLKSTNADRKIIDNYLKEVVTEVEQKTGKDVWTDGMDIYTNLDFDAQKRLYDIVNTDEYINFPNDEFQVASTLVDVKTGKVLAQIGGRKIPDDVSLGTNQAVNTDRDWGSTMKPMSDYGPAIENLKWPTAKMLNDAPYNYPGTNTPINNWDNQFMGEMTIRKALTLSRNVPAVKTLEDVGLDKAATFVNKLGIDLKDFSYSNAISSNNDGEGNKYGVSSLKIAAAYAAFANGGTYYKPYYVNKINYQDGTSETFEPEGSRAMKESTAYMITDMLKDVISSGTGNNAAIPGLYQAGKTGTSNYNDEQIAKIGPVYETIAPDENFVGFSPHFAISVWTGYKDKLTPVTESDFYISSEVYRELMQFISTNISNEDWKKPGDVLRIGNELYLRDSGYIEQSKKPAPTVSSTTSTSSSSEVSSSSSFPQSTTSSELPVESSTAPSSSEPVTPPSSSQPPESNQPDPNKPE
jgi:penicillin-binding protein 1A